MKKLLKSNISNRWINSVFRLSLLLVIAILVCSCDLFESRLPSTSTEHIDQEFTPTPEISSTIFPSATVDSDSEVSDTGLSIISSLPAGQYIVYSMITVIDDQGTYTEATKIISIDGEIEMILLNSYYEEASISPGYQNLAFNKNRMIYLLSLVDNTEQPIIGSEECRSPTWSPDGSMLAFDCSGSQGSDVYIASVADWDRHALQRKSPSIQSGRPIWSPNGKWIAYFAGEFRSGVVPEINGIYITSTDSILEGKIPDANNTMGPIYQTSTYSWAPNGECLAYLSQPDEISLFTINTQRSQEFLKLGEDISDFIWSSDGKWIAFSTMSSIFLISTENANDPLLLVEGSYLYLNFWINVE